MSIKITDIEKQKKNHNEDLLAIESFLGGNDMAFKIIQKKYSKIVANLIRRMVKDEDDVMDLTQETFIKAYRALNTYQTSYSFSSWLYRIASNNCIDFLRKKRFNVISLDQPLNPNSEDEQYLEIVDTSNQPEMDVIDSEKREALFAAIDNLPENYREIIKLRHEEDLDYKEISEKLNLPLGTVKAHLFRARKMLYDSLKSKYYMFV